MAIICFPAEAIGDNSCNSGSIVVGKENVIRAAIRAAMREDADIRKMLISVAFAALTDIIGGISKNE